VIAPPVNVYDFVDNETAPVLPAEKYVAWDIRLDWGSGAIRVPNVSSGETSGGATPTTQPSAEARRQLQITLEQQTDPDLVERHD